MSFKPIISSHSYPQEFGYGLYDGISGLVTQPLEGAKKDGLFGLIKGFGKGLGGVVLKPQAGKYEVPFPRDGGCRSSCHRMR